MTDTTRKVVITFLAFVLTIGLVAALVNRPASPEAQMRRVGAVELPTNTNYIRWWAQSAACLGLPAASYDARLRYFVGPTVPHEWTVYADKGKTFRGYVNAEYHFILLSARDKNDSTVIVHEQLHNYFGTGALDNHPKNYFDGRCGVSPEP